MKIRYCTNCRQNVGAVKSKFSVLGFLIFGLFPYLLWYAIKPKTRCPKCNGGLMKKDGWYKLMDSIKKMNDKNNKFAILVYDDDIKMCKQYKIWKNKLFDSFVDADEYKEENLKEYTCYVCKIYF